MTPRLEELKDFAEKSNSVFDILVEYTLERNKNGHPGRLVYNSPASFSENDLAREVEDGKVLKFCDDDKKDIPRAVYLREKDEADEVFISYEFIQRITERDELRKTDSTEVSKIKKIFQDEEIWDCNLIQEVRPIYASKKTFIKISQDNFVDLMLNLFQNRYFELKQETVDVFEELVTKHFRPRRIVTESGDSIALLQEFSEFIERFLLVSYKEEDEEFQQIMDSAKKIMATQIHDLDGEKVGLSFDSRKPLKFQRGKIHENHVERYIRFARGCNVFEETTHFLMSEAKFSKYLEVRLNGDEMEIERMKEELKPLKKMFYRIGLFPDNWFEAFSDQFD
jgi:hypothetical protein